MFREYYDVRTVDGGRVSRLQEIPIIFLRELENEFIHLYRQGRYAAAVKKAQQALVAAQRLIAPRHPYRAVLENNLRCAREALLKYSPMNCCPTPGICSKRDGFYQGGGEAGRNRTGISLPNTGSFTEGVHQQQARGKRWLAGGLLAVFLLLASFLLGWTALNKEGADAVSAAQAGFAPGNEPAAVAFERELQEIRENSAHRYVLQAEMILEVPLILQNPELPRGCEVTSLAMLLQYAGVSVDKMTLAREIKKDPAPYQVKKGKVYFGNPYNGFVGNMYTLREPGYGVYHGPVRELLEKYLPGRTIDLTGCTFEEILLFISEGVPVWVVANATFAPLAPSEFQTWHTPQGPVEITYREHAVLLTGYDAECVYFNDPRFNVVNKRASRPKFAAAWEQMGRQAVTYLPY